MLIMDNVLLWRLKRAQVRQKLQAANGMRASLLLSYLHEGPQELREGYRKIFDQGGRIKTFIPRNLRKMFFSYSWKMLLLTMKHKKDISVQINTAISQGKVSRAWYITLQDKRKQKSRIKYTAIVIAPLPLWKYNAGVRHLKLAKLDF